MLVAATKDLPDAPPARSEADGGPDDPLFAKALLAAAAVLPEPRPTSKPTTESQAVAEPDVVEVPVAGEIRGRPAVKPKPRARVRFQPARSSTPRSRSGPRLPVDPALASPRDVPDALKKRFGSWAETERIRADGYFVPNPTVIAPEVRDAIPVGREQSTGAFPFLPGATLACYWRQLPRVNIQLPDLLGHALGPPEVARLRHVVVVDTSANRTVTGRALSVLNSVPRLMVSNHLPDCDRMFIRSPHDAAYLERAFSILFLDHAPGPVLTPMVSLDRYRQLPLPYAPAGEPSSVLKVGHATRLHYGRCIAGDKAMRYHVPNRLGDDSTLNPGDTLGFLVDVTAHFPRLPAVYRELELPRNAFVPLTPSAYLFTGAVLGVGDTPRYSDRVVERLEELARADLCYYAVYS